MAKIDKPDKVDKEPKPAPVKTFTVISHFRDKDDFSKEYFPGEDVSFFDPERLEHLKKNGLVKDDQ